MRSSSHRVRASYSDRFNRARRKQRERLTPKKARTTDHRKEPPQPPEIPGSSPHVTPVPHCPSLHRRCCVPPIPRITLVKGDVVCAEDTPHLIVPRSRPAPSLCNSARPESRLHPVRSIRPYRRPAVALCRIADWQAANAGAPRSRRRKLFSGL